MDSDKFKEVKYAMNARMFLLIASIVLIVNAVSSTMMDGIKWFNIVGVIEEYDKEHPGEEESLEKEEDAAGTDTADDAAVDDAAADNASPDDTAPDDAAADGAAEESREIDVPALKKDMKTLGISINDLRFLGFACIFMVIVRCAAGAAILRFSNRVDKAPFIMKTVIGLTVLEAAYIILTFLKRALFLGALIYTVLIMVFLYMGAFRMKKLHEADPDRILAVNTQRPARPQAAPAPKKSIRERAMLNTADNAEDSADNAEELADNAEDSADGQEAGEENEELPMQ